METPSAFHHSALEDPLFAAEGMDLENAEAALSDLEEVLPRLEREYARGSLGRRLFFVRYPLSRYAVPTAFLHAFLAAERARRAYRAAPSFDNARALLGAWQTAARAYRADARRYARFHHLVARLERGARPYAIEDMFGRTTSSRDVALLLEQLQGNGAALEREVARREELLAGASLAEDLERKIQSLEPLARGELPSWHRAMHEAAIAGGVSPFRFAEVLERQGPFRFTLAQFDSDPTEHLFVAYFLRDRATGRKGLFFDCADLSLFHGWPTAGVTKQEGVLRGAYAACVGISLEEMPFWYEPATYLYNSRDLSYWPQLATRLDLELRPELDRPLLSVQQSSLFDRLLAECARDGRTMLAHLIRRRRFTVEKHYSMLHDLLTHSLPGAYYLTFNGSVWRLPEAPHLAGETCRGADPAYYLREEEAREKITPEVLEMVMRAQRLRERRGRDAGWLPKDICAA